MKINCLSLKIDDDDLFNNRSKRPIFLLRSFLTMLNLEGGRLSLKQLEYEMDYTDYPVDNNCGRPNFPYTNIQLEQSSNLILSYFQ